MMEGMAAGAFTAGVLSMVQRILCLEQEVNAWYQGMRATVYAMIILIPAWALGSITVELKTADYLVSVLGDALPVAFGLPWWLALGGCAGLLYLLLRLLGRSTVQADQ